MHMHTTSPAACVTNRRSAAQFRIRLCGSGWRSEKVYAEYEGLDLSQVPFHCFTVTCTDTWSDAAVNGISKTAGKHSSHMHAGSCSRLFIGTLFLSRPRACSLVPEYMPARIAEGRTRSPPATSYSDWHACPVLVTHENVQSTRIPSECS